MAIADIEFDAKLEKIVYQRPASLDDVHTHYCPGCTHGTAHRLVAEVLDELELRERTILVASVGCSVFAYNYFNVDACEAPHGRAPAMATGIKRVNPDNIVFTYQGDGDLASIGMGEIVHAASRGEQITVIFINNAIYGMTGGQMAPTTLVGEKTETSPAGRDPLQAGYPLHMAELINQLQAPVFIARVSFSSMAKHRQARQAIRKALEIQRDGKGYAFVEVLMACPTNQKMNVEAATRFVAEQMEAEFPLGILRDRSAEAPPIVRSESDYRKETLDHLLNLDTDQAPDAVPDPEAPTLNVKMAGFGGQGVLSLGVILARAACAGGRFVSWYPSYGPEQRGGTANCGVVISGLPVGTPVVYEADVLVAMNRPSLEKFMADVKPGGRVFYNAAIGDFPLPAGVRALAVPAQELAQQGGSPKAANTAMLGVLAVLGNLGLPDEMYRQAIARNFAGRDSVIQTNLAVYDLARDWAARARA